jgi:hypothetical protein
LYPHVIQLEARLLELEREIRLLHAIRAARTASDRPRRRTLGSLVPVFRSHCVDCA